MHKTKLSSLLRVGLSLLLIAVFLSTTSISTAYASNQQERTVTVTVRGIYNGATRTMGRDIQCTNAKIEIGKYKKTFWATKVNYSNDSKYASFCDLTFTNVTPHYSGLVTVYWTAYNESHSSSMYMGWGDNGGSMGSIDLKAFQNDGIK